MDNKEFADYNPNASPTDEVSEGTQNTLSGATTENVDVGGATNLAYDPAQDTFYIRRNSLDIAIASFGQRGFNIDELAMRADQVSRYLVTGSIHEQEA